MHYRYQPYPYYRRYYNIDPYYYRRYYNPYNIYNSQISDVNQNITNFGDMNDVIQNVDVFQSMSEHIGVCTSLSESPPDFSPIGICTEPGICISPNEEIVNENPEVTTAVPFPL